MRAAVDAAAGGFELFDDLHGADFGSAGEGAGGEAGAEGVDGGEVRAKRAFERADEMHDVRVALDEHEVLDLDGAEVADAADVVAAEVDEHDVLGELLFVGAQIGFEAAVFGFVGARGGGCRRWGGTRRCALWTRTRSSGEEPTMWIGFGFHSPCCRFDMQAQEVHVGRGIDDAQRRGRCRRGRRRGRQSKRWERTHWKTSPAAMYSLVRLDGAEEVFVCGCAV